MVVYYCYKMESGEINWDLYILCQESTSEPLRSTEEGIQSLSNSLLQFKPINALPRQLSILCSENCELQLQLQNNNAKYHHKCKSKYNARMYNRAKKEFNEFIDVSPAEIETLHHRHTLRSDVEKSFLGELKCIFCTKYDDLCNLMAAGTYHAPQRKVNTTHLKELETKWGKWASCIDEYVYVDTASSMGDLAANELYYHKVCYSDYYNAYCRQQTQSCIETDEQWIKSISFNKII